MVRFSAIVAFSSALAFAIPIQVAAVGPALSERPTSTSAVAKARISAHLTDQEFTASEAGAVRLVYSFSKRSRHFQYRLMVKRNGTWQTVHRVQRIGRFKGSHTMALTKLFAGSPVEIGDYRLKVGADVGHTTLGFSVTQPEPAVVTPQAGTWRSTVLSGPVSGGGATVTELTFTVGADQASVTTLGFGYTFTFASCSSGGFSSANPPPSPIANAQFQHPTGATGAWTGQAIGSLTGTFDSPTSAHGTGTMKAMMFCTGFGMVSGNTGTFSWTATRS